MRFPDELAKTALRLRAQLGSIMRAVGSLYSTAGKLDAYAAVLAPVASKAWEPKGGAVAPASAETPRGEPFATLDEH